VNSGKAVRSDVTRCQVKTEHTDQFGHLCHFSLEKHPEGVLSLLAICGWSDFEQQKLLQPLTWSSVIKFRAAESYVESLQNFMAAQPQCNTCGWTGQALQRYRLQLNASRLGSAAAEGNRTAPLHRLVTALKSWFHRLVTALECRFTVVWGLAAGRAAINHRWREALWRLAGCD
jgi:hypothetical protein